jgi:hypothetical protein
MEEEMPSPVFCSFTANYGETVSMDASSSAEAPKCWLRIKSSVNKNDMGEGEAIETEAHMTVDQARVLVAGIASFLEWAED